MKKKKPNIPFCVAVTLFLLSVAGCSDEQSALLPSEGTPLIITAAIGTSASPATRVAASNGYDRSEFIASDQINVVCSRNNRQLGVAGYMLDGATNAWTVAPDNIALGFLPATVCRASFPIAYDGILDDQHAADGSSFLQSNYLLTPEVPVSGAKVSFTGTYAFKHENAKLTLTFKGSDGVSLSNFTRVTIQAPGLQTGSSSTVPEVIIPFCPNTAEHTWCAVVYPQAKDTEITVTVIDQYNVTYKVSVRCGLAKATNYTYTFQLRNDVLVPVGDADIKNWDLEVRQTNNGGFDSETPPGTQG